MTHSSPSGQDVVPALHSLGSFGKQKQTLGDDASLHGLNLLASSLKMHDRGGDCEQSESDAHDPVVSESRARGREQTVGINMMKSRRRRPEGTKEPIIGIRRWRGGAKERGDLLLME